VIDGRSVAEEVYRLVHGEVFTFVLRATLVGAVLGELRLLERVELDGDECVQLLDPAPTGFPVLDSMVDRLAAAEPRSPYQWVLEAGDEVCAEVAARAAQGEVEDAELVDGMLTAVRSWLRDRRRDSRLALLGRLLWNAERASHLRGLGFRERRRLDRAAAGDWAALLPRNAWGSHPHGSFDADRGTVWRRLPAPIQAAPRWTVPLLSGLGAALIAVAILLQASADPPRDLRASGVPTTAVVKDVQAPKKQSRKYAYETTNLVLEFRYRDFTHLADVRCVTQCRTEGESVQIWHDPDDPADFVTEWGDASRAENGNPAVWLPALAGAVLLLAAVVVIARGRMQARRHQAASISSG